MNAQADLALTGVSSESQVKGQQVLIRNRLARQGEEAGAQLAGCRNLSVTGAVWYSTTATWPVVMVLPPPPINLHLDPCRHRSGAFC
jgi:hypothetical protein